MAGDPERFSLRREELERIFREDVEPAIFGSASPVERPTVIVFGGQPGAGKSAAISVAKLELGPGAIEIVGDDLRPFHPRYGELLQSDDKMAAFYTDRDTGRWVEMAIQVAAARRVPTVIEGTMRDAQKVAATCRNFREAGFDVEARALAVSERLSWLGVLQRYEAQKTAFGVARMTIPAAHQAALDGLPVTLDRIEGERLVDRVGVYRRGQAAPIYQNELDSSGAWTRPPAASTTLHAERDRPPSLEERRSFLADYQALREQLARPARSATAAEFAQVDQGVGHARDLLAGQLLREASQAAALREAPQLAGAYAVLEAASSQLPVGQLRSYLANMIERGRYPELDRSRDERDR